MTAAYTFFRLYAPAICDHPQLRGMSRTVTLCLQVPIVTTILWGQLAGKTMAVLPRSLFFYCTAMLLGLSNPYIFSALWRQRKSKNTAHYMPILHRGLGEAVVTNDWCIIYSLCCTSHEHLVLSHPKNIR